MCISCSPICGHCRPPRKRAVFCPECGEYNLFDIVVAKPPVVRTCKACGADLTELATPKTVFCRNMRQPCANPCGYSKIEPDPKIKRVCWNNTPPP